MDEDDQEFLDNLFDDDMPSYEEIWQGLQAKVAPLAQPAIRLTKTMAPARSWLGGQPKADSPDFPWPTFKNMPLDFIAQLSLEDLAAAHPFDWLPATGSLLFFYEKEEMVWGFDPEDRGNWQVVYVENAEVEIDLPDGLSADMDGPPAFLTASKGEVFPPEDSSLLEPLGLDDDEEEAYATQKDEGWGNRPMHQVGGFPAPVQGDCMEMECQLVTNGHYCGDGYAYDSDEAKTLAPGAKDWRLLFQFDSDDDLNIMWGDLGRIYFWVKEQDAKAKNFDNAWLILQCS